MTRFLIREAYSAQIESRAVLGIRVGYTCMGIAVKKTGTRAQLGWLRWNLFPCLYLTLFSHTGQRDQWKVFRIQVGRVIDLSWRTKGECDRGDGNSYGPILRLFAFR